MALGVTAFSEAPFASEDANVIAYPQGNVLTSSMGEESNTGTANVTVTGNQATMSNGGVVAGSSVLVSVTGSQLSSSIGDETAGIGVELTGIELSISNKTFTQDTLTAFGEAPFATLSPSTFNVPSVIVEGTTGAGTLPSFLLQSSLGTFSVSADGNVSVVVTEHTMNSSIASVSVSGLANVSVTGISSTLSLGAESASADFTAEVTGQQLTSSMGEETPTGNAIVTVSGISMTSSIGSTVIESAYDVTGVSMSSSIGSVITTGTADITPTGIPITASLGNVNITAWAEIDPGVSNVWTTVDRAA